MVGYGTLNGRPLPPKCYTATYGLKSFRYEWVTLWSEVCDLLILIYYTKIDDFKAALLKSERVKSSCSYILSCI